VKDMKKGEVCRARCKAEHSTGARVAKALAPAGQDVTYEVELLDLVKEKEPWEMSNAEKFEFSITRREEGNAFFKAGQFRRAAKRYKSALECVKSDHSFDADEKKKGKDQQLLCLLNQAACAVKLGQWKEAVEHTTKALELDSSNPKALFRRAQAHIARGDLDLAQRDLNQALEKQPSDKEVRALLSHCLQEQKKQDQKDKAIFSKMFAAVGK